jgi:hypothetical protein
MTLGAALGAGVAASSGTALGSGGLFEVAALGTLVFAGAPADTDAEGVFDSTSGALSSPQARRARPETKPTANEQEAKRMALRMPSPRLNVQVANIQGVLLDELSARFDLIPHQDTEQLVSADRIFDAYLEQRPPIRVHRRFPQLVGIHLA